MKVTNIKVTLINSFKVKAIVDLTLDNELEIRGIRIVKMSKGNFLIAFPNERRNERFYDIAHPINTKTRNYLQEEILKKYREILTR